MLRWIWSLSCRHIYQVFSCGLHISCIERNWLPFSKCCITFDKSYDNFWRGNVFFRNLKDSCDGSGLNTSKSSKGSCPYFRYCWVVMLSTFHIKLLRISSGLWTCRSHSIWWRLDFCQLCNITAGCNFNNWLLWTAFCLSSVGWINIIRVSSLPIVFCPLTANQFNRAVKH